MEVAIIGMGPGDPSLIASAGLRALEGAQAVLGARRALDGVPGTCGAELVEAVLAKDIAAYVREHGELERVCIAVTGDAGVFSGARAAAAALAGMPGVHVRTVPGISSVQYLAARLVRPWQGWRLVSAHGVACDAAAEVARGGTAAFFCGGDVTPATLCAELAAAGLGDLPAIAGERLSYADERIVPGTVTELSGLDFDGLSILLVDAPDASDACSPLWPYATHGIPDGLFERGDVPMTKQEVRAVALAKLRVSETDTVWDIGSGTGSCPVELALAARRGRVAAVERKPGAAALTRGNARRFGCANVEVVEGTAPGALAGLPAPDAVFIGGSAGKLEQILDTALTKNPRARVCVTCIALETLAAATAALTAPRMEGFEACSIAAARDRKAGPYHLMQGQNPIFILSARGAGDAAPGTGAPAPNDGAPDAHGGEAS
mgnify:CR=1 FL=1